MDTKANTICGGNCGRHAPLDEIIPLNMVPHLFERIEPGEEVPAGECPECGALCHLDRAPDLLAALEEIAALPQGHPLGLHAAPGIARAAVAAARGHA